MSERLTPERLEQIRKAVVTGWDTPRMCQELLVEIDALKRERDGLQGRDGAIMTNAARAEHVRAVLHAADEVRDLARCYEDSFLTLEAEWPEIAAAIRRLLDRPPLKVAK